VIFAEISSRAPKLAWWHGARLAAMRAAQVLIGHQLCPPSFKYSPKNDPNFAQY
jgi:hypothetical protein